MSENGNDNYYKPLVVATTAVTVLVSLAHVKLIARPVQTILSRLYLRCLVLWNGISNSTSASASAGKKSGEDATATSATTAEDSEAVVTALFTYPVKSLRAVPCDEVVLDSKGFVGDRRFMLVTPAPLPLWASSFGPNDATHRFLTQRQCPSLARVVVTVKDGKMTFSCNILPNDKTCTVSTEPHAGAPLYKSTLWGDIVTVQDMGDDVAAYLQTIVAAAAAVETNEDGTAEAPLPLVRLVAQHGRDTRAANDKFVPAAARSLTGQNPRVALSDGFPLLIASEASLAELNRRLRAKGKDALPMSRFRPNIVLRGIPPFAEDRMKVIRIGSGDGGGGVVYHVVSACPRCKQSCTDQSIGVVTDEPVETLRDFRTPPTNADGRGAAKSTNDSVYFAVNAIPAPGSEGRSIRVGDGVRVLQWGEPVWGDP